MKATAKVKYHNELTEGEQYEVVAILQTDYAISGWVIVIAHNDDKDFGTYDANLFFESINDLS